MLRIIGHHDTLLFFISLLLPLPPSPTPSLCLSLSVPFSASRLYVGDQLSLSALFSPTFSCCSLFLIAFLPHVGYPVFPRLISSLLFSIHASATRCAASVSPPVGKLPPAPRVHSSIDFCPCLCSDSSPAEPPHHRREFFPSELLQSLLPLFVLSKRIIYPGQSGARLYLHLRGATSTPLPFSPKVEHHSLRCDSVDGSASRCNTAHKLTVRIRFSGGKNENRARPRRRKGSIHKLMPSRARAPSIRCPDT